MSPADRVAEVRGVMASAAAQAHRAVEDVCLVAASKTQSLDAVATLAALGIRDFGENYAQELAAKMDGAEATLLSSTAGALRWHFIGRVQRGNARTIVRADMVHGVGSLGQAVALAKASSTRATPLPILLQVNIEDEDAKNGFSATTLTSSAAEIATLDGITVEGVMSMPQVDTAEIPAAFARVALARAHLSEALGRSLPWLSLGMSADFAEAILVRATHIRVGTRLFGPRPKPA